MNDKTKNSFVCFLLITYEIQKKIISRWWCSGASRKCPRLIHVPCQTYPEIFIKIYSPICCCNVANNRPTNQHWKHNLAIGWSNKTWVVASDNYTHTYTESGHRDNSPATRGTEDCLTPQPQLPQPVGIIAKEYINESWSLISSIIFGEDQPYLSYTYMHVLRVAHAPVMPPPPLPPISKETAS